MTKVRCLCPYCSTEMIMVGGTSSGALHASMKNGGITDE